MPHDERKAMQGDSIWTRFPDRFIPSHVRVGDAFDLWRARGMVWLAWFGFACGVYVAAFFPETNVVAACIGAFVVVAMSLVLVLMRSTGSLPLVGNAIPLVLYIILIGSGLASGGTMMSALFLVGLIPMEAMLLVGHRAGIVWAGLTCVGLLAVSYISRLDISFPVQVDLAMVDANKVQVSILFVIAFTVMGTLNEAIRRLAYRDVSQARRRAEKARQDLAVSEARYRGIVENAPLGIIVCDVDGGVKATNDRMLEIFELNTGQVAGEVDAALGEILGTTDFGSLLEHCTRSGQLVETEFLVKTRVASELRLRVLLAPLLGSEGRIIGVQALMEDITEAFLAEERRQAVEEQIRHTQKLESLGVLAGGIAHDFNNLLTPILGNAGVARSRIDPQDPLHDLISGIEVAAKSAAHLTREMLAYAGKGRFVTVEMDLSELMREVASLLTAATSPNVTLHYELEESLDAIEADPGQMRQVLINLITNAAEAIGEAQGRVTLKTGSVELGYAAAERPIWGYDLEPGSYIYLEVKDDGCGMDADTQERIFEPFFTTKFTGRGLGLSALLGIVRGHEGALDIQSEPGRGTSFSVFFPSLGRPALAIPERPVCQRLPVGIGTILVADDDEPARSLVRYLLEGEGFHVLEARDGREAVALFEQHHGEIVCVLLDLMMPHMDGSKAIRAIKSVSPDVRVLLCSGYGEETALEKVAGERLSGFLQKPYEIDDLVGAVRTLVA